MNCLRQAWYMLGWSRDFLPDVLMPLEILGQPLVAYRRQNGDITLLEDRCCHRLAPLSLGRIEGDDLRCLYHGLKFSPDGACNEMPGGRRPPRGMQVRSFPVLERYSAVFAWMGEAERADATLLPEFIGVDDPRWRMLPGRMDYDAGHELIQDNLLDLSHVAWVHRNSFGRGEAERNQAWAAGGLEIVELERGVRVTRWMRDAPTPPRQAAALGARCDRVSTFDYLAPGIFLMHGGVFPIGAVPVGTPPEELPWDRAASRSFTAQAVTPLGPRRTAYFFCFGPAADEPDAEQQQYAFRDLALLAFAEDRTLIEAQQKIIDADPTRRMALFDVDRAPALYRRVLERLQVAE